MDTLQNLHLNADACIGRINPLEPEPRKQTIFCPETGLNRPSMTDEQCIMRLTTNALCRNHCQAVDHLRDRFNLPAATPKSAKSYPDKRPCTVCGFMHRAKEAKCVVCRLEDQLAKETTRIGKNIIRDRIKRAQKGQR